METKEIFDDYKRINDTTSIPLSNYINDYVAQKSLFRSICDVDLNPKMNAEGSKAIYDKPKSNEELFSVWTLPGFGYIAKDSIDPWENEIEVPIFTVQAARDWHYNYMEGDKKEETILLAADNIAEGLLRYEEEAGWKTIIPYTTTTYSGLDSRYPANIYELPPGDPAAGYFSKELINRILVAAQRYHKNVNLLWVSPEDMADIREYTETDVDPTTRKEIFEAAGMGSIWSINLRVVDSLGIRGKANINRPNEDDSFRWGIPLNFDKYGKINDYKSTHQNVVDEYGQLVCAGETQIYAFTDDITETFKMPIAGSYKAMWDPNLIRRMRVGFFGWQKMGMCLLGQNHVYMGVIDRYVP
jgi:hypothetical protein